MTSISPDIYRALAIRQGLEFYRKHGMKINRMYTPKNMMATAEHITGEKFKARDYATAEQKLRLWIEAKQNGL